VLAWRLLASQSLFGKAWRTPETQPTQFRDRPNLDAGVLRLCGRICRTVPGGATCRLKHWHPTGLRTERVPPAPHAGIFHRLPTTNKSGVGAGRAMVLVVDPSWRQRAVICTIGKAARDSGERRMRALSMYGTPHLGAPQGQWAERSSGIPRHSGMRRHDIQCANRQRSLPSTPPRPTGTGSPPAIGGAQRVGELVHTLSLPPTF
jgi:hypothetical protein